MKRVVEGKMYNTETAAKLCELDCDFAESNFRWHETALYQTRDGAFFPRRQRSRDEHVG